MRLGAGVSKLIVFAMLVTLVFPFAAITAFAQDISPSGALEVEPNNQLPRLMKGVSSAPLLSDNDVLNYLESTLIRPKGSTMYGINSFGSGSSSLSFIKKSRDRAGQDHYMYQNTHQGIAIYGEYARVHLDASRRVKMIQNGLSAELGAVSTTAKLSAAEAIDRAKAELEGEIGHAIELESTIGTVKSPKPEANLLIYPQGYKYVLAYEVDIKYIRPESGSWVVYVNAVTGTIIDKYSKINHHHSLDLANKVDGIGKGYNDNGYTKALNLYHDVDGDINPDDVGKYYLVDVTKDMFTTYHNENQGDRVIVTLDWETGDIPSVTSTVYDEHAVDAHYNTGVVYDFYQDHYGWSGINGLGGSIVSMVHVEDPRYPGMALDNAFWNGLYLSYGDGSGDNCFACALDVVAHEFTHAVTEFTVGLEYRNQSGALNESISDIMAAVIDNDDWTIGEDTGVTVRNMQAPSAFLQPAHMD